MTESVTVTVGDSRGLWRIFGGLGESQRGSREISRELSGGLGVLSGVLEWFQKLSEVKTTEMLNFHYKYA